MMAWVVFIQVGEKIMRNKLPVAIHLTDAEYRLLFQVYADHNSSISLKHRADYLLSEVVKVERNPKDFCLALKWIFRQD